MFDTRDKKTVTSVPPEAGAKGVPEAGAKSVPEAGAKSVPEAGAKSVPEAGRGVLPEAGRLKIFVSYSRADLSFADELAAGLEVMGFESLIDPTTRGRAAEKSGPPGETWNAS